MKTKIFRISGLFTVRCDDLDSSFISLHRAKRSEKDWQSRSYHETLMKTEWINPWRLQQAKSDSVQRVKEYVSKHSIEAEIRLLEQESTRTSSMAAESLGCSAAEIAKTIGPAPIGPIAAAGPAVIFPLRPNSIKLPASGIEPLAPQASIVRPAWPIAALLVALIAPVDVETIAGSFPVATVIPVPEEACSQVTPAMLGETNACRFA
jgi:hypothetical protein